LFKERNATHQSDIFGLGVILFEITTGHKLFKRKDVIHTVKSVLKCRVPPPTHLVPGYPKALEDVIYRSVTPNPEDRYQTAAEMAKDLDAFIASQKERVTPAAVHEFVSQVVVSEESGKSFDDMTIGDFVKDEPSLSKDVDTVVEGFAGDSDSYGSTDVRKLLESLTGGNKKKGTNYAIWLNGFLVSLIAFAALYFLVLRPSPHPKPPPKQTRISKPSPPEFRWHRDLDYVRPMERRPAIAFFTAMSQAGAKAETGTLKLRVQPRAEVRIDGRTLGKIRVMEVDLPKGRHVISASADGYNPLKKKIKILSGKNRQLKISLKPIQAKASDEKKQPNPTPVPTPVQPPPKKLASTAPAPPPVQPVEKQTPEPKPEKPPKKVPHLGFVTSPLRQAAIILKVLAHDQGRFANIGVIRIAVLYDDDPFSKKRAEQVYAAMKRLAGRAVEGKRVNPVMVMVDGLDETVAHLRSVGAKVVYLAPMDRSDVRIALRAAGRVRAATVTGVAGYQRVGACLSLGRKDGRFSLLIKKRKCSAEGMRFDEKILELAEVY